ncbi:MAG TPA: DUF2085 domain-containing protein [Pyrinomonadaceae bacterium]|jgi:uncharacterized membrane protein
MFHATFFFFLYRVAMFAGSLWCHQRAERSPHVWGVQMPVCWRCSGIIVGAFVFLIWLIRKKRLPPFALSLALASLLPLDVLHAIATGGEGDNLRRLLTGVLWGIFGTGATLHLLKFAIDARVRRVAASRSDQRAAVRLT